MEVRAASVNSLISEKAYLPYILYICAYRYSARAPSVSGAPSAALRLLLVGYRVEALSPSLPLKASSACNQKNKPFLKTDLCRFQRVYLEHFDLYCKHFYIMFG